ncbi:MAG: HAD-IA family hydrolase [Methanobacteriota archaeon]
MSECFGQAPGAILFDLDNTLCTFVDAKRAACDAVIAELGTGDREELFSYFLRPVHNFEDPAHISDYLIDIGAYSSVQKKKSEEIFTRVKIDHIGLYPGVIQVLDILVQEGIQIAIVTDAHSTNARIRMKRLNIDHYFPVFITPDISGQRKPDHTPFLMAMNQLHASPDTTWVVGDSLRREIQPGRELGLTTIYARYGDWIMADNPEIKPHYTLEQFCDLMNIPGLLDLS